MHAGPSVKTWVVTQLALWPPHKTITCGAVVVRVQTRKAWCPGCDAFIEVARTKPDHAMRIHYRRKHNGGNWTTDSISLTPPQRTHVKHRIVAAVRATAVDLNCDPDIVLSAVRNLVNSRDITVREGPAQRKLREMFNDILGA